MRLARTMTALLTLAIAAMVVSDAYAQGRGGRPGAGRGPGGRGGPGGFRGGGFPGGGDSYLGLLRVDEVREELELDPVQEEALGKLQEQIQESRREAFSGIDFREARDPESDVRKKMEAAMQEVEQESRTKLEEVLFPMQMERLEEIRVQQMGMRALRTERVATELELTAEQKNKFEEIEKEAQEKREEQMGSVRELFQSGDRENIRESMEKMREKMEEFRKDIEDKMHNVLTAEQQKEFKEMKGKPFEMPEPQGRGGFGRRGGGPDGGGRGGRGGGRGGRGGRGGGGNDDN